MNNSKMAEQTIYEDEYEYDEIVGERGKKRKLDILNKRKVTEWEMDELFCEFE